MKRALRLTAAMSAGFVLGQVFRVRLVLDSAEARELRAVASELADSAVPALLARMRLVEITSEIDAWEDRLADSDDEGSET